MRVAVTAYCACNGLGATTAAVIENLRAGKRGLSPCPLDVPFETMCGVVDAVRMDDSGCSSDGGTRQVQIALTAYAEIADAVGEAITRFGADRVGACLGTSTGGIARTEYAYFQWRNGHGLPANYDLKQHSFHTVGRELRAAGGWRGPTNMISTACSSSAKAFSSARRLLQTGRCDAVLVGGVDSLGLTTVRGFHSLSASSSSCCRPFSAERDGMNVGEGAAFLLLQRDDSALIQLAGVGESNDAFHMSAPDPQGRGAIAAMRLALADAGLEPSQIDYVNAHGTGTVRNDTAEATAIAEVVGTSVPVVSTKSCTGHMLGAGGATEAVFAVAALEHQWIPGNLDVAPIDPAITIDLPTETQARPLRHVLSNSFAFGGSNVSLAFSRNAP